MTRPSVYLISALAAIGVAACTAPSQIGESRSSTPPPTDADIWNDYVWVAADPVTGCDYLVYAGFRQGGITSRLRPDGSPYCEGATQ